MQEDAWTSRGGRKRAERTGLGDHPGWDGPSWARRVKESKGRPLQPGSSPTALGRRQEGQGQL